MQTTRRPVYSAKHKPGLDAIRGAIAKHFAGTQDPDGAAAWAHARWGAPAALAAKALASGTTDDVVNPAFHELIDAVRERTILARAGFVEVPFRARLSLGVEASAAWVAEHQGTPNASMQIPVSDASLSGQTLDRRKVASMLVATLETLQYADEKVENYLRTTLLDACAAAIDRSLLDPNNSGVSGREPASISSSGTPVIAGTGDSIQDVQDVIDAFEGDFARAIWITDAKTAVEIASVRTASGAFAFPGLGMRGGSLLGAPVLISRRSPRDTSSVGGGVLTLVDPSAVCFGLDFADILISTSGFINQVSDPENDSTTRISLFQTDSAALKAVVFANWSVVRPGSVSVLSGVNYAS